MRLPTLLVLTAKWAFFSTAAESFAAEITEAITHNAAGFDIPIIVVTPTSSEGPYPVVYHVHGGGWNGGTETKVPAASVPAGWRFLTDELGIIHVGLAYRAKLQGNFSDAMQDLRDSIAWFEARAEKFDADLTRVGFSGGSAGTPLSAVLAQEHPASRSYVGLYGVYDLLKNTESLFPNEEARADFGLDTPATQRAASPWHQLRAAPPAALLFHGGLDILTHPSQSRRFAAHLQQNGASAAAIIYPEVNHGFFSARYPDEYRATLMRVAQHYVNYLGVDATDLDNLDVGIEKQVAGTRASPVIEKPVLLKRWKGQHDTYEFKHDNTGTWTDRRNQPHPFTYQIRNATVVLSHGEGTTTLHLQQNHRALYLITESDPRRNGQRFHFTATR